MCNPIPFRPQKFETIYIYMVAAYHFDGKSLVVNILSKVAAMAAFWWISAFITVNLHLCGSYETQPRITAKDGHLIFTAATRRNISFTTSEGGCIYLNGIDLGHTANMARNASEAIQRYTKNYQESFENFNNLGNLIHGEHGIMSRLRTLESNRTLNLPPTQGIRLIPRLNRKLNNLERKVRNLMLLMSKDECNSNPCKNGGTCVDMFNSYLCHCPPEWEGLLCDKDVNECARFSGTDLGCQNGATCINKPGTYQCMCSQGWFGMHCTRRNLDCNSGSSAEICGHGTCISTNDAVGYKCICDQGWKTDNVNPQCNTDINECELNKPPCSVNPLVSCINVPGSFYCGNCPDGYTGNGYYCTDKNECEIFNGGCSVNPMVQCINTIGSRMCGSCPPGYEGNGVICNYRGICSINNGGCHNLATCRGNSRISSTYVECECPSGYIGNGIGPNGCIYSTNNVDLCASKPCVHGTCSINNQTGNYECTCSRAYTGKNCDKLKDLCNPNYCQNNATCVSLLTTFRCVCGPAFTGTFCEIEREACGGKLRGENGVLKFPLQEGVKYGHGISCAWTITTTDSDNVLNITFSKFQVESSNNCIYDFLQIHDGRNTAAHSFGRFCGNDLPLGGNIITTHNVIFLWFRSDRTVAKDGFSLTWNSTKPQCGGKIDAESHGTIYSPGSPGNYPHNRDCYWEIEAQPGKRILFHFFSLIIGDKSDCSGDYLEFTNVVAKSSTIEKYCNTSHPEPLYTKGNEVTVHFHSGNSTENYPGFQITYSVVDSIPGCGGVYTQEQGEFESPSVDGRYLNDLLCEYKIKLSPESKIKVTFLTFAIEESETCDFDAVSLYDGSNMESPLIGRYCGTTLPAPYISTSNELLVVFQTDWATSDTGFRIKYETICGGVYVNGSGTIQSPGYPEYYAAEKVCVYEIVQPLGKSITLTFVDFDIESNSYPKCVYDYLEIRDGANENATLIGRYCNKGPDIVISTYNYLWLKFKSDPSVGGKGFKLTYTTTDIGCGGILKDKHGTLSSPDYPNFYPTGVNCKWYIVAPVGNVIQLTWLSFHIEESLNCVYDHVNVFDNNTESGMGGLIGTYCGSVMPPTLISSSNIISINFHSDETIHSDGFLLSYTFIKEHLVCGAKYFTSAGLIKSPHYPEDYPTNIACSWAITVPPGQQIMLNITDFNLESYGLCRYDWLEIHNGGSILSPLIGKYCGTKIPKVIPSHANQLFLYFKSDMTKTAKGFKIYWSSATTGCGGILTSPIGTIISPHYPEPYNRNAECFWKITISAGSIIQIVFSDIDLEPHESCMLDYVEIFDGNSAISNSLGKFCSNAHPPFLRSTSNNLAVKFRSDISYQGRGFQLQYTTICSHKVKDFRGIIESPNFPNGYPRDQKCEWEIEVWRGNKINVTFSHFDLEHSNANNSCEYDYVKIKYLDLERSTEEVEEWMLFGQYCGSDLPPNIAINSMKAKIEFVSDSFLLGNGFRLEWQINGCGGILTHPNGVINTPNYPEAYPVDTQCVWKIQTEVGKSIQLHISDLFMEESENCDYDFLKIFDGPDNTYPAILMLCHQIKKPVILTSTGNTFYVMFQSDTSYSGKGFIANYTTVPSKCGGTYTLPNGVITSPNYPKNFEKNTSCDWLIEIESHHIIELEFEDIDLAETENCTINYIKVYDGPSQAYPLLAKICGSKIPNIIKSSSYQLFMEFRTSSYLTSKGFKAKYATACGAHMIIDKEGIINFDNTNKGYVLDYNCTWVIEAKDPSKHVFFTFTFLNMRVAYCSERKPLEIYEGNTENNSTLIDSFCGNKLPPTIVSSGSALLIGVYEIGVAFSATYSVLDNHCGGTLLGFSGYFASPNYPNTYPVETECEWTINVAPGNTVGLSFSDFELVDSDKCNFDFLEIRKNNRSGPLIGTFCGNNMPENVTHIGSIWMLFRSVMTEDDNIKAKGFLGEFTLETNHVLSGRSGQIASPTYPEISNEYGEYTWRVSVSYNRIVYIKFIDFNLEHIMGDECYSTRIDIYNGFDETAPLIGSFCGLTTPDEIKTTSNVAFIKFYDISFRHQSKFLLEWREGDYVRSKNTSKPRVDGCGNDGVMDLSQLTNYTLKFPSHPMEYEKSLSCEWIFSTNPENHLSIRFWDINLESIAKVCYLDKVSIYTGKDGTEDWQLLKTFCSPSAIDEPVNTSNLMKVVFTTDRYRNETSFSAVIYQECGASLFSPNGVIALDNTTIIRRSYRNVVCIWNITVATGRTVEVSFDKFEIAHNGSQCNNFIMLRNGIFPDSPFLGKGKYCGNDFTDPLETTGNTLSVMYSGSNNINGFKLKYKSVSLSCDQQIILTQIDNSTEITSPNYPNIPQPHIECKWIILGPPGDSLQIDFLERFDLTQDNECAKEAVEIRNGGTEYSPLIGKFCKEIPSTQFSTDNMLFVKYMTNVNIPRNGFKAKISLARCGGTIRDKTGEIRSPFFGMKTLYPKNIDCTWHIIAPQDHELRLKFTRIDLPKHPNCTDTDSVIINDKIQVFNKDGVEQDTDLEIGKYCGNQIPDEIQLSLNEAIIHFKTDNKNLHFDGFSLNFTSKQSVCGGTIETDTGTINSPGYPVKVYAKRHCEWIIKVPEGRRITLQVNDLDFDHYEQGLAVFNDVYFKSNVGILRADDKKKIIKSSQNIMFLYYWAIYSSLHRGFSVSFSSNEPTVCIGSLKDDSGVITNPQNISKYYCTWTRTKETLNGTLALSIDAKFPVNKHSDACKYSLNNIFITTELDVQVLAKICKTLSVIIRSPFLTTKVTTTQTDYLGNSTFTISYKNYPCGGIIANSEGYITNPKELDSYECSWLIKTDKESIIKVNFVNFDLGSDCDKAYILIYNGNLPTKPVIGKYCQRNKPDLIKSQANNLLIEYHVDNTKNVAFNLTYEMEERGCGGIINGANGILETPNYPNNYMSNSECLWEIHVLNGFRVELNFIDRFHLEDSSGCLNDFIEVFDWVDNEWVSTGKRCGRVTPVMISSSSNKMRVLFRSNDKINAAGFKALWSINCGGKFIADNNKRYIVSPGYPDEYISSLTCVYEIEAIPRKDIYIEFEEFVLEKGRADCRYDNVSYKAIGLFQRNLTYCGQNKPPAARYSDKVIITFKTDKWVNRKGFKFYYTTDFCGGVINKPTVIQSPNMFHYQFRTYTARLECVWNITAPPNQIVILKFEKFYFDTDYIFHHLLIYDGPKNVDSKLLLLAGGNLTSNLPIVPSRSNQMLVIFNGLNIRSNPNFKAVVYFTYGPNMGCGGVVNLTTTNAYTLQAPQLPDLDCHWEIKTIPDYTIQLQVTELNLPRYPHSNTSRVNNCSRSYLQIKDGGPLSEDIEKICSNDMLMRYFTSNRYAYVRYVAKANATEHGFKIVLTAVPSICGSSHYVATNNTQIITSPNYPNQYQNNTKCTWVIKTRVDTVFRFTDLDLSEIDANSLSINKCSNDKVEFSSEKSGNIAIGGFSPELKYMGETPFREYAKIPFGTHQFCGKNHNNFEMYYENTDVKVTFTSTNTKHGKGFSLEFKTTDCNRNFTQPQGLIKATHNTKKYCLITITAPENHTISLYFNKFIFGLGDCKSVGVDVNDTGLPIAERNSTQLCGISEPTPIFSKTNKLSIKTWTNYQYSVLDATYVTTDKGRGCGGTIYNYYGKFSSPLYPSNYRKNSTCIWEIYVPVGQYCMLTFEVFDLRGPCVSDNLVVTTYDGDLSNEHRFCGEDNPARLISNNRMTVTYRTSINNGGTGWIARFVSKPTGS